MSGARIARMGILSPIDAPAVSTVLEAIIQFFDEHVASGTTYKIIQKHVRLRMALMALGDLGWAQLDATMKPKPMVVPTEKLFKLLELS
jgi:hypothetical protein